MLRIERSAATADAAGDGEKDSPNVLKESILVNSNLLSQMAQFSEALQRHVKQKGKLMKYSNSQRNLN